MNPLFKWSNLKGIKTQRVALWCGLYFASFGSKNNFKIILTSDFEKNRNKHKLRNFGHWIEYGTSKNRYERKTSKINPAASFLIRLVYLINLNLVEWNQQRNVFKCDLSKFGHIFEENFQTMNRTIRYF